MAFSRKPGLCDFCFKRVCGGHPRNMEREDREAQVMGTVIRITLDKEYQALIVLMLTPSGSLSAEKHWERQQECGLSICLEK